MQGKFADGLYGNPRSVPTRGPPWHPLFQGRVARFFYENGLGLDVFGLAILFVIPYHIRTFDSTNLPPHKGVML